MIPSSRGPQLSRRGVLLAAAAGPLVVACTTKETSPPEPDPLAELAEQARVDAALAAAVAASFPGLGADVVAANRGEHAQRLAAEVERARTTPSSAARSPSGAPSSQPVAPPADAGSAVALLADALAAAQRRGTELLPDLPTHRSGLVGAVVAGCACLAEVLA
ncbi:hypothetical protein [Umezawaea beigongshangensis]|uniref:hypothetical protein n=1 Tax=Umezawaea beigongshangensis TaxID=2780383 RepID=UPI0027DB2907|nr:hypothetical protein [Umezawaea beigongshangensis]